MLSWLRLSIEAVSTGETKGGFESTDETMTPQIAKASECTVTQQATMATAFKKSDQALAELLNELGHLKVVEVGPEHTARQWGSDVAKMCQSLEELSAAVRQSCLFVSRGTACMLWNWEM